VFRTTQWDNAGEARYVRYPAVFKTWGHLVNGDAPPRLGADNDGVFGG
jgi:hypothetical protein